MAPGQNDAMPPRRRTDPAVGRAAVTTWRDHPDDVRARRTAVRFTLEELADIAPGHTVEVRVPPDGAVQAIDGPRHTRGTPPNVVETDPLTWIRLAAGRTAWRDAVADALVSSSGERADLGPYLPLLG